MQYLSIFRDNDGDPVRVQTDNGGTVAIRFLSVKDGLRVKAATNRQWSYDDLVNGQAKFRLELDGSSPVDWNPKPSSETRTDYGEDDAHDGKMDCGDPRCDLCNPPIESGPAVYVGGQSGKNWGEQAIASTGDPVAKTPKPNKPVSQETEAAPPPKQEVEPVKPTVPTTPPKAAPTPKAAPQAGQQPADVENTNAINATNKRVDAVSQETSDLRFDHGAMTKRLAQAEKDLAAEIKLRKETKAPILKIEIRTPNEVKLKDGLFHNRFPQLVKHISLGLHSFLPGPPGTGKSHAAALAADALGWKFGALSLGPTTPESRLLGGMDANGRFHEPPMVEGCRYAQANPDKGFVFCLDEMDNGHPGILATMNSLLANGWFFAPNGDMVTVGANVAFIAAANTYGSGPTAEFSGRNKLDPATLDRFLFIPWETDESVETTLVRSHFGEGDKAEAMATEWLMVWRTCRQNVADNRLKIHVTMRGAIYGAKMIAAGMTVDRALRAILLDKLPADQAAKISPL